MKRLVFVLVMAVTTVSELQAAGIPLKTLRLNVSACLQTALTKTYGPLWDEWKATPNGQPAPCDETTSTEGPDKVHGVLNRYRWVSEPVAFTIKTYPGRRKYNEYVVKNQISTPTAWKAFPHHSKIYYRLYTAVSGRLLFSVWARSPKDESISQRIAVEMPRYTYDVVTPAQTDPLGTVRYLDTEIVDNIEVSRPDWFDEGKTDPTLVPVWTSSENGYFASKLTVDLKTYAECLEAKVR